MTRTYHAVNTKYNIYFNAEEAYKEALNAKTESQDDNLSEMLYIYPYDPDASEKILANDADTGYVDYSQEPKDNIFSSTLNSFLGTSSDGNSSDTFNPFQKSNTSSSFSSSGGGGFTTTIDKCTKAIKLHSIKVKPRRDRSQRNNEKFKAWWKQQEFNPALKNVWLLLGKAELQNENYLQSVSTFMYASKIYSSNPEVVAESQLWIARNYTEMGWMYEAADVLYKLEAAGVPEKLKGLHASVYANYLMRNNEYDKAIPYMDLAIKGEKNKIQKLRLKYILGQLYAENGDNANAYKAFGKVQGMTTPYKYSINARISQLALDDTKPKKEIISKLKKYTKGLKNENYYDKVYYTIGNLYLQEQDTVNAVKNYMSAIKESKQNGYDKTLAQIKLGGLYFDKRQYILAQPCYSGALASLKKTNPNYPLVSLRSAVLDELVIHARVVHEQDSLQYLAKLPEDQRLLIINDKIEQLKKEEKEKEREEGYQQKMEERENQISSWDDLSDESLLQKLPSQNTQPSFGFQGSDNAAAFYFYNSKTVEQGKISFQKQWGNRKLEDNWRRRNKASLEGGDLFAENNEDMLEGDSIHSQPPLAENLPESQNPESEKEVSDVYSVDYYLQQLPLTEEKIKQSNVLIEDALFNMGGIYKNKLEDLNLAKETYELDLFRFPETPNKEDIYYQLFLIYMQLGDRNMMAMYRDKLMEEFSGNKYALMLSDPNYEWNLKNMHILQDSIYESTYEAYLDSDIKVVRDNYESIRQKYPFSNLMPKFMLLNALTYAQTRDVKNLKNNLDSLTKEYPQADVTEMANDILSHIKEGRILLADGTPIRGMKWNIPYEGEDGKIVDESELHFADNPDDKYMMLLFYKSNTIDRNELLYQVADYNFSNYIVQTFDLSFEQDPPLEMLQIKGFNKFTNIKSYLRRAFEADGLAHKIDPSILMIPVSIENSKLLLTKGLDEYIAFYKEHYAAQTPELIAYWGGDRQIIEDYEDLEDLASNIQDDNKEETKDSDSNKHEDVSEDVTLTIKPPVDKQQDTTISQPVKKADENNDPNSTDINASDIFSQDQIDIIQSAGEVLNNPVDGIKGLFNKYKNREKLTKEEKEALKEERQKEKERQKELKAIERIRQDSIAKVEKAIQDSIKQVERERLEAQKQIEEEQKRIEKEKQDAIKAKAKAKEDARKEKERQREESKRAQDEKRKAQEKEREERRKEQERERDKRRKEQEELRKQKEREQKERRRTQ